MFKHIDERDLSVLVSHTQFRMAQMLLILKNFKDLDRDDKGYLTTQDVIHGVPGIAQHAMSDRIVQTMRLYEEGYMPEEAKYDDSIHVVDFHAFVRALDLFCGKGKTASDAQDDQLKFLFKVYDQDEDGYISKTELYELLKLIVQQKVPSMTDQ